LPGRKPTPTHLKLVKGNPGRRPIRKDEPDVEAKPPAPPEHLSEKARRAWDVVSPLLERAGILATADAFALEMLCEAYGDYLDARDAIEEFGGNYYETKNAAGGTMHRAHPAVAVMRDADRRIRGWLAEFGMTPSARTRVSAQLKGQKVKDPAEKYF
jgi:P27 family predicted phage terminase small subunit